MPDRLIFNSTIKNAAISISYLNPAIKRQPKIQPAPLAKNQKVTFRCIKVDRHCEIAGHGVC